MAWLNYGSSQSEACIPQLSRPIGSLYIHNFIWYRNFCLTLPSVPSISCWTLSPLTAKI